MREAGQRVQPNPSRYTVASIICKFRNENLTERRPGHGGRHRLFTPEQETAIVNIVVANNIIRLWEIQNHIIADNTIFNNIHQVGLSTLDRVLQRNRIRMKHVYMVPFERNLERVKEQRYEYVQRVLELDAAAIQHVYIYIDEAGFNLAKRRGRWRNIIGHRAIANVPGQRGGNITVWAAVNQQCVLHHHANLGPYNTAILITFLDTLHDILIPTEQRGGPEQPRYVAIWDNVSFHRAAMVHIWFIDHPQFIVLYLRPYSPFLNPIEEFLSA